MLVTVNMLVFIGHHSQYLAQGTQRGLREAPVPKRHHRVIPDIELTSLGLCPCHGHRDEKSAVGLW